MEETPLAVEIDCSTGEVTKRPLTPEEVAQQEIAKAEFEMNKAKQEAEAEIRAAAKASAEAKLAALGLTAEEIAAL